MPLQPGDAARVVMTKWGGRAHSAFTGVYLGSDGFGDWVGARVGTRCWRRETSFNAASDWVTLVPTTSSWEAGFYDPARPRRTST